MRTRKGGIYAAAAILIMVLILTNCLEPLDLSDPFGSGTAKEGYGILRVIIAGNNAKTIVPSAFSAPTSYTVDFLDTVGSNHQNNIPVTIASNAGTVTVPIGEYTVTITGYSATSTPIGKYTHATTVSIANGTPATIGSTGTPLVLTAIEDDGTGHFAWNLSTALASINLGESGTAGDYEAKFVFTEGTNNPSDHTIWDSTKTNATGISVNSGTYKVTLTVTRTGYYTFSLTRDMHIYQNLTSEWLNTDLSAITLSTVNAGYTAGFDVNGNETDGIWQAGTTDYTQTGPSTGIYNYNTPIPFGNTLPQPAAPTHLTLSFNGWYTEVNGGAEWNFSTQSLWANRTLHAFWSDIGSGTLHIHLASFTTVPSLEITSSSTISVNTIDIQNAQFAEEELNRAFVISNMASFTANTVKVDFEGTDISDLFDGTDTLTINFAAVGTNLIRSDSGKAISEAGTHVISISAEGGGKYWSRIIYVTVNP